MAPEMPLPFFLLELLLVLRFAVPLFAIFVLVTGGVLRLLVVRAATI